MLSTSNDEAKGHKAEVADWIKPNPGTQRPQASDMEMTRFREQWRNGESETGGAGLLYNRGNQSVFQRWLSCGFFVCHVHQLAELGRDYCLREALGGLWPRRACRAAAA
jgi:hypothetical protein